jgi:mediator of RNA polymerase II transcription subunit 31
VQCLANPLYLQHLASQKLFDDPAFIAYLDYLRYFQRPEYITFLSYPGPTLKALELVQNEQFRKDILSPEIVARMIEAGVRASVGEA